MVKRFSISDVEKHADDRSTWIIIHNDVYDITQFLNDHPGGVKVLLPQAGKDASEDFEDLAHSSDARELMVKYKIGEIVDSQKKPIKKKTINWSDSYDPTNESQNSSKSWLVLALAIGLVAMMLFGFYFQ